MRLWTCTILVACTIVASAVTHAVADTLVYTETLRGDLAQAGNSIGLSKQFSANGPGLEGSIGTFITTDLSSTDIVPANGANPWFAGTTNAWQLQESAAILDLPADAAVTHAQLVWGGSYNYIDNVTSFLDASVSLSYSTDQATDVAPDPALSTTIAEISPVGVAINYYVRSANVTGYVASRGAGQYAVGGIPATQNELNNSLNAGGWALIVAFERAGEPLRNLQVRVGGDYVSELATSTVLFTGFETPYEGSFDATLLVAAMEGDADRTSDQMLLRDPSGTLVALGTAARPTDNFFASLICDETGLLDTTGSFGSRNHAAGSANLGARQGWDITGIPLSNDSGLLANGQLSLEVAVSTSGDELVLCAIGLATAVFDPATAAPSVAKRARLVASPNPFNPSTTISYGLPNSGHVELTVYDAVGRRVKTLVSQRVEAGIHDVTWDGQDAVGRRVASGVYLCQLRSDGLVETESVVLVK